MTVICAKKFKDRIEIVSDTQSTRGNFGLKCNRPKIQTFSENCIVGFSGLHPDINTVSKAFKGCDINSLQELEELMDGFYGKKLDIYFIAVINKKIYVGYFKSGYRNYFEEVKEGKFIAVGSGSDLAIMGSEFTDDLVKIVKNVCKHDIYCSLPYQKITIKL